MFTPGAFFHGASLVHFDGAATEIGAVKHLYGAIGFLIGREFNESESLGTAAHLVDDNGSRINGSGLGESFFELLIPGGVRKASYVEFFGQ